MDTYRQPSHRADLTQEQKLNEAVVFFAECLKPKPYIGCVDVQYTSPSSEAAVAAFLAIEREYGSDIADQAVILQS